MPHDGSPITSEDRFIYATEDIYPEVIIAKGDILIDC